MSKKSVLDLYLIIAAIVLIASSCIWFLSPPDLTRPMVMILIYRIWIPLAVLVVAVPVAILTAGHQPVDGFLSRTMRLIVGGLVVIAAITRIYLPPERAIAFVHLENPAVAQLQKKSADLVDGGVHPPPADFQKDKPSPFPAFIAAVTPAGNGQPKDVDAYATALHQASEDNHGNKKAQKYLGEAAATAAALYVMYQLPPPGNVVVAQFVGKLVAGLFGSDPVDPGKAFLIGQLVNAVLTGTPDQVRQLIEKSGLDLNTISRLAKEIPERLLNDDHVKEMLTLEGKTPGEINGLIQSELNAKLPDLKNLETLIGTKLSEYSETQQTEIINLITKRLPVKYVIDIKNQLTTYPASKVFLAKDILDAMSNSNDRLSPNATEKKALLEIFVQKWRQDTAIWESKTPNIKSIYDQIVGNGP
jgi:hypothetical protein